MLNPPTNDIFTRETKERFWKYVDNRQAGRCWNWTGAIITGGYGTFWYNCTQHNAHKFSWIMHYGPVPGKLLVCHKCDNKKCVNPVHLYLGTYSDNLNDRYESQGMALGGRIYYEH